MVRELVEFLSETGYEPEGRWLEERLVVLEDPHSSADAVEHVRAEMHASILGMGGLIDLVPKPEQGSTWSVAEAGKRLLVLADRLYLLTEPSRTD
jgi:hypothetical protein